ncbi:hypothetical protein [Sphaerisporangium corydalis]|nr:hypothetical protein [Sphaerisporangium corydalis]
MILYAFRPALLRLAAPAPGLDLLDPGPLDPEPPDAERPGAAFTPQRNQ